MDNYFSNDITPTYLDKFYEDLHKEQLRLMTEMKNFNDHDDRMKETDIQKQLIFMNTLMINALRLKNLKKTIMKRITGI